MPSSGWDAIERALSLSTSPEKSRFHGQFDVNRLVAFAFGLIFISTILAFSLLYTNPSPFQLDVFTTVLALSAAGVGAILPGTLDIRYKGIVRGGGAIGLFVIVYLFKPAIAQDVASYKVPTTDWNPVAEAFLAASDSDDIPRMWLLMDPATRALVATSEQNLAQVYTAARVPRGAVVRRTFEGISGMTSPPGVPPGVYKHIVYRTKFANDIGCRSENMDLRATSDLKWKVFDYNISPQLVDCGAYA